MCCDVMQCVVMRPNVSLSVRMHCDVMLPSSISPGASVVSVTALHYPAWLKSASHKLVSCQITSLLLNDVSKAREWNLVVLVYNVEWCVLVYCHVSQLPLTLQYLGSLCGCLDMRLSM